MGAEKTKGDKRGLAELEAELARTPPTHVFKRGRLTKAIEAARAAGGGGGAGGGGAAGACKAGRMESMLFVTRRTLGHSHLNRKPN